MYIQLPNKQGNTAFGTDTQRKEETQNRSVDRHTHSLRTSSIASSLNSVNELETFQVWYHAKNQITKLTSQSQGS